MAKLFKVPFDKYGNQLTWCSEYEERSGQVTLKDPYEFRTYLKYVGFSRGRSALNITWMDKEGKTYESGMSVLNDMLTKKSPKHSSIIISGEYYICGTFGFKKQGTSVLLCLK